MYQHISTHVFATWIRETDLLDGEVPHTVVNVFFSASEDGYVVVKNRRNLGLKSGT